jgi:hypothetical protein
MCVDCNAVREQLRYALECLRRCATELEYVQAVENCDSELCASGEGRAAADEAWRCIDDNYPWKGIK